MAMVHKTFIPQPGSPTHEVHEITELGTTTEQILDASATNQIDAIKYDNSANSAITYLKMYNALAGAVTQATTEAHWTFALPAIKGSIEMPKALTGTGVIAAGLSVRAVTAPELNNVTSPAAAFNVDFLVNNGA